MRANNTRARGWVRVRAPACLLVVHGYMVVWSYAYMSDGAYACMRVCVYARRDRGVQVNR
jgi:hypothetical protein